jgi:hypothetical protein
MAYDYKAGGNVVQGQSVTGAASQDPDAFAPQATGVDASLTLGPRIEAAVALAGHNTQTQTTTGSQTGFGGDAGGDVESFQSGNIGPMQG